jgi:hypothetical protein
MSNCGRLLKRCDLLRPSRTASFVLYRWEGLHFPKRSAFVENLSGARPFWLLLQAGVIAFAAAV